MLSSRLEAALNAQIHAEFASAYLYLGLAARSRERNYGGFAHWLLHQSREECDHALKLLGWLHDWRGTFRPQELPAPRVEADTMTALFRRIRDHEQEATQKIHALYALAGAEKAYAVQSRLQWFLHEQVEEENTAAELLVQLERIQENPVGLLALDRELGRRGGAG